jgi:hypothetical protein
MGIGKDDSGAEGILDPGGPGPEAGEKTGLLGLEQELPCGNREIHQMLVKAGMGIERGTPGPEPQV